MEKNKYNETRKKRRIKKDDYIRELEMKNRELVLINQLLNQKIHSINALIKEPVRINSDWVYNSVEEAKGRKCAGCGVLGDKEAMVYNFAEDNFWCFKCRGDFWKEKQKEINNKNNNSNDIK